MEKYANAAVESQIRQYTERFELTEIDVAYIDAKKSLAAQNRDATTLDESNVLRIMLAVDTSGIIVPPIIVNRVGARYLVVDGNHRVKAWMELGRAMIPAYVVQVDQDTYTKMCIQANAFNGKPLSDEERMHHAIALVEMGEPATIVAPRWGFKDAEEINRRRRAQAGRAKALGAGLSGAEVSKLSDALALVIHRMEPAHVRLLAAEIPQATATDLEVTEKAIAAVPSAQRKDEALRQAGRLQERRQERKQPRTRNMAKAFSQATARRLLREFLVGVRANPATLNDDAVQNLLRGIWEEVQRAAPANTAA